MSERQVKGINSPPPLFSAWCSPNPFIQLRKLQRTIESRSNQQRRDADVAGKSEPSARRRTNPPVSLQCYFPGKRKRFGLFLTQTRTQGWLCFSTVPNHTSHPRWHEPSSSVELHPQWLSVTVPPPASASPSVKWGENYCSFLGGSRSYLDLTRKVQQTPQTQQEESGYAYVWLETRQKSRLGGCGEPQGCPSEAVVGDDAESLSLHPPPGVWGKFG